MSETKTENKKSGENQKPNAAKEEEEEQEERIGTRHNNNEIGKVNRRCCLSNLNLHNNSLFFDSVRFLTWCIKCLNLCMYAY